jgi:hypothetical protein
MTRLDRIEATTEADFVRARDLHKTRIKRLQRLLCECPFREFFQANLHEPTCPVHPDWKEPRR